MYVEASTWPTSYQSISVIAEILNRGGWDSRGDTREAIYKRGIGDPKPCRERERAD